MIKLKLFKLNICLGATGRQTNLDRLGLNQLDPNFADIKKLPINKKTKQLADMPIFIVGDAALDAPIQHEAAHAGKRSGS